MQLNRSRVPELSDKDVIQTKADQQRFDDLTKFYARMQNVYNVLTGNKNLNVSTDKALTMDTIAGAKDNITNKLGDVFMNDPVYELLLNQSVDHMVNTLDIQSLGRNLQLKHSLVDMMYVGVGGRGAPVPGMRVSCVRGGSGWAGLSSVRACVRPSVTLRNGPKGIQNT